MLGIDAIWLSPFYKSPMADGGYDVADPTDVDPMFGTLADFDTLVTEAHARDIKVTVDIVPNHFSDQHAWFQAALAAGPGSPERARFIFRRRPRPGRRRAAQQLAGHVRRLGLAAGARTASGTCTSSRPNSPT